MSLPQINVIKGDGRYRVEITAILTGDGISITLAGGEKPHVGGVVICLPDNVNNGFSTVDMTVPGHRDTEAARPVAEMVCRLTGEKTVVVCGIHIDDACSWEIDTLLQNCMEAARQMAKEITKQQKRDTDA